MASTATTIWLDQTSRVLDHKLSISIHLSLCKVDPYLITFQEKSKCVDYIQNFQEEEKEDSNLIIIVSTEIFDEKMELQNSDDFPQIKQMFILTLSNMEKFELKSRTCEVYTNVESLCNHLGQLPNIRRSRREGFVRDDFILNALIDPSNSSHSSSSATQLSDLMLYGNTTKPHGVEFMYAQILRDVLVRLDSTEQEIIEFCRAKYVNNKPYLNTIEEFENYYDAKNAIFWYTRDTFLCRLLNKALREQDINILYPLRHFIKDVHSQVDK